MFHLNIHWRSWCWSWSSNTLATWCELTHWKRPWCWESLKARGEGDLRRWNGRMASLTQWTWVCAHSGSWWWTGRSGVLQSMWSQRLGHDWATELNWLKCFTFIVYGEGNGKLLHLNGKMNLKYLILELKYIFLLVSKFYISCWPLVSIPKKFKKWIFDIFM